MTRIERAKENHKQATVIRDELVKRAGAELRIRSAIPWGSRMTAFCVAIYGTLKQAGIEDNMAWAMAADMTVTP